MIVSLKKIIFVLLSFLLCANVFSQNLYWAGFAFIENKNQSFRYLVTSEIFEQDKLILSGTLKKTLSSTKRTDVKFIYDTEIISDGDSKAVAFALADESIERIVDKFGVTTKYIIYGQVLIFDFIENKILANYPVVAISALTTKEVPNEQADKNILKTMYLDIDDEASIFSQWTKMFENVKVKETLNKYLKAGTDVKEILKNFEKTEERFAQCL